MGGYRKVMKFPDRGDESYLDRLLHNRRKPRIGQTGIWKRDYAFLMTRFSFLYAVYFFSRKEEAIFLAPFLIIDLVW